jgi:hypothetical protein
MNDGGPAFPQPMASANGGRLFEIMEKSPLSGGMSLRDYFAAAAVQSVSCGIMAETTEGGTAAMSVAISAYKIAEAMLVVRSLSTERE